jgi:hypothetical protein
LRLPTFAANAKTGRRDATRQLATGRTGEALEAYRDHDMLNAADTRDLAREQLIDRWG